MSNQGIWSFFKRVNSNLTAGAGVIGGESEGRQSKAISSSEVNAQEFAL